MILKNTKLKNNLKKIVKNAPEIEDIILFGSLVRGKQKPNDIDILVIFKNQVNKNTEYLIRKELEKHHKTISIISKTKQTILEETFDARESILFEGISLLTNKNPAKNYGFAPLGMFKYSFKDWNKLQKTKFYHALNGRGDKKGIANLLNCIKLSDGLILVPLEKIEELKDFLNSWKLEYLYIPLLIPHRLNKKKILE